MVARSTLDGTSPLVHWQDTADAVLLDVREPFELAVERAPEAVNIPLGQLRGRLDELPKDREIHVICRSGQRAHYAVRMLRQSGFEARHLAGGMLSRAILSPVGEGLENALV